jgi:LysR family transcriptional regulator, hydrogen peroxide-inducible genes activator
MTLTQLEYILAVDTHRHFGHAAESCFVTQPTLSMQIQKLEDDLGVKIFDRTRQPVIPTEIGKRIIAQARHVLLEADMIRHVINEQRDVMAGELRIGIIPTLAPYVLPFLYKQLKEKYPQVELVIREAITEDVITDLKDNRLDCGLVVTPLNETGIKEDPLFYEELFVYVSKKNQLFGKKYIMPNDINPDQLWLLEEGHCFRSQILNLCELRRSSDQHFKYETGNIETLKRMVEKSDGITILPELAIRELSKSELKLVKRFRSPFPVREVSMVTHRDHIKTKLIAAVKDLIRQQTPGPMHRAENKRVVEINQ